MSALGGTSVVFVVLTGERQDVSPPIPEHSEIVTAWNRATNVAPLAGTKSDRVSMVDGTFAVRLLFSRVLIDRSRRQAVPAPR